MIITKEGALASFYTVNKAPIKHLRVYFSPKQAGSGDPSPENVREINGYDNINLYQSNINLLNLTFCLNREKNGTTTTVNSNGTITIVGTVTTNTKRYWNSSDSLNLILQPGTYSLYPENLYIEASNGTRYNNTFSLSTSTTFRNLCFIFTIGDYINKTIYPILSKPDKINSIYFPSDIGTIYGGYVDLITGELVATHRKITMDGVTNDNSGKYFTTTSGPYGSNKSYSIPLDNAAIIKYDAEVESAHGMSNMTPVYGLWSTNGMARNDIPTFFYFTSDNGSNAFPKITFPDSYNINTVAAANNWLAELYNKGTPFEYVYPFYTPVTYQLTPVELTSFIGQNNIWSNADRIEVEYELAESNDELYRRRNIILNSQPHLAVIQSENATNASNIAHFNTDITGKINSLKINFSPIQSGSGDPSPNNVRPIEGYNGLEVTRCGKNLLKYTSTPYSRAGLSPIVEKNENNEVISIHWSGSTTDSNWFNNINYLPNKYNVFFGNFTLSTNHPSMPIIIVRDYSGGYRNNLSIEDVSEYTINFSKSLISSANTAAWYRLECWPRNTSTKTVDGKVYPMVRFPNDEGTFEPYNGQTITISLPSTIYGGYVDLISGKLIQTHTSIDLYNQNWTVRQANESSPYVFSCTLPFKIQSAPATEQLCNIYPTQYISAWGYATPGYFHIYTKEESASNFKVIYFAFNDINNLNDFQTWLINNSIQVVVKLDTPITYQITPQTLNTLRGINNIWSNTNGNIEVSYWTH